MTAAALIQQAQRDGLVVAANGERLRVEGPSALRAHWLPILRQHRDEIVHLLTEAANDPSKLGRTCKTCTHLTRHGTCGVPVAAGLAQRFGIRWPAPEQAASCPAYAERQPQPQQWPHDPASDAECAAMLDRIRKAESLGATPAEADTVADVLLIRDRQGDDRRLCIECRHVRPDAVGWRCISTLRGPLARDLVVRQPHRCEGFQGVTHD